MAIATASHESSIDLKGFEDILGRSLTDEDVKVILQSSDAVNKIMRRWCGH